MHTTRKAKADRTARADLFWLVASVVALQLGLAVAVELWLPQLRDPYYAYRAQRLRRRLAEGPERPLSVVMLGSSRTQKGLRGAAVEPELAAALGRPVVLFNFGLPGAGPIRNLLHCRRLLAEGIRPDVLLIELVPFLLGWQERGNTPEMDWLSVPGRLWYHELEVLQRYQDPAAVAGLRREWWRGWPAPWFTFRFEIVSRCRPGLLPDLIRLDWARRMDESGWAPPISTVVPPEQRRHDTLLTELGHRDRMLKDFRLNRSACAATCETLEVCRREGIPAAVVLMPEGDLYRSWYAPATRAQIQGFLDELRHEFQVPVVDARTWIAEEDFNDSHHLLVSGADQFTRRLTHEFLSPLLRHLYGGVRD